MYVRWIAMLLGLVFPLAALLAPAGQGSDALGAAAGCAEVIADGGFEAGGQGWTQSSAGGYNLVSDFNPYAGRWGAFLAGDDNADDRLSQAIVLPAGATSIGLAFRWQMSTLESGAGVDTLAAALVRPDETVIATLLQADNTAAADLWQEATVDLTSYAGQSLTLRFAARTDASRATSFFVDQVSVLACAAGASTPTVTPVATASLTGTPTRTATPPAKATLTPTPTATRAPAARSGYLPFIRNR
jgi:kumamolisin